MEGIAVTKSSKYGNNPGGKEDVRLAFKSFKPEQVAKNTNNTLSVLLAES